MMRCGETFCSYKSYETQFDINHRLHVYAAFGCKYDPTWLSPCWKWKNRCCALVILCGLALKLYVSAVIPKWDQEKIGDEIR